MKTTTIHVASLLLLGMLSPLGRAQDKPKAEEKPKSEAQSTPAKALIVFTEYDGDKKVKSLPYTLYINAPDEPELKVSGGSKKHWCQRAASDNVPAFHC